MVYLQTKYRILATVASQSANEAENKDSAQWHRMATNCTAVCQLLKKLFERV
jgi:hypothetical protein